MSVEALHARVVDRALPVAERTRALSELRAHGVRFPELAWRETMHEPLRTALAELGLLAETFDEDFAETAPLLDLDVGMAVRWALARLRLRCVAPPKDLLACTGAGFRAALARVTGLTATLEVIGTPRAPTAVRVVLGSVSGSIGLSDPARDVFALLAAFGPSAFVSNLAIWLASDAQLAAAARLGLVAHRGVVRVLDPHEAIRAIVPDAKLASLAPDPDDDHEPDLHDERNHLIHTACSLSDRITDVVVAKQRVSLAIDGAAVTFELRRMRPRSDEEHATRIFDALAAVLEPRLGARPVLAAGYLVVLVTPAEHAKLRDAGVLG